MYESKGRYILRTRTCFHWVLLRALLGNDFTPIQCVPPSYGLATYEHVICMGPIL